MEDGARDYKEFKQNGLDAFQWFLSLGLKPTDRVLDVGSGIGRKTLPLLDYLDRGSYEGLDPVAKQVRWCASRITPQYPNFRFRRADIWSKHYNPSGKIQPSHYTFPFADAEFDFVILGSVFTHMFPGDVRHYISEIARTMRPGARGWITFFLLNRDSLDLLASGKSTLHLIHPIEEGSLADNPERRETAIGHREANVLKMFKDHEIMADIVEYGSWCGRSERYYQDIVKLTRL